MQRLKLAAALAVGLFATSGALAEITPGFNSNTFTGRDDAYSDVADIGFTVNFFGQEYTGLHISENGNVVFGGAMPNFSLPSMAESTYPIIAPFFADVSGNTPVTYGTGTYNGQAAFGVNWIDVTPYKGTAKNSFQLLLVDRANGDFDIVFNYGTMVWDSVTHDSGSVDHAIVGYSTGLLPRTFHQLSAADASASALTDQQYVFQVRAVPEPETFVMLLAGLGIVTAMARRHRKND